ncbi:MAG: hypothetical protein NVS1B13_11210 [Flavisolibacter sp.]
MDIVHHIFKNQKVENYDPDLKKFKNQVYQDVEKYELRKIVLRKEIEKSTRKIRVFVIILVFLICIFLVILIL